MSFDFSTLVTDRTQADVDRVKAIAAKIRAGTATEAELSEWNSCAMKGAYNYTDLNRVTAAMEALKAKLEGYGYSVPGYHRIKVPHPTAGSSRLPEGYTELSWIQSTGTQYIDSGFVPNQDTRVVCKAILPVTGSTRWLFGVRKSASSNAYGFAASNGSVYLSFYNTGSVAFAPSYNSDGVIVIDKNKDICTLTANSVTSSVTGASGTFTAPYNLALFACNSNGTIVYGKCVNDAAILGTAELGTLVLGKE